MQPNYNEKQKASLHVGNLAIERTTIVIKHECTKITFLEESEALTPQSLANSTFLLVSKVVNTTPPVQRERDNIHNRDFNLQV